MRRKVVGTVTQAEISELQVLFNKKRGLEELMAALPKTSDIYDRVMSDYIETSQKFHDWWDNGFEKYTWEAIDGANWQVDFKTCEIYLQV